MAHALRCRPECCLSRTCPLGTTSQQDIADTDACKGLIGLRRWGVPSADHEKRGTLAGLGAASLARHVGLSFTIAATVMLWSSPGLGATLTWNSNTESDLAGYRVYQCAQLPCGKASPTATLLAILGKVTSFDIGTPAVVQHYFVTAHNFANKESGRSNVVTYTPPGFVAPPPPPPPPAPTRLQVGSGDRPSGTYPPDYLPTDPQRSR